MTVFQRLFPNSIGTSLKDFLFGSDCPRCKAGSFTRRWNRYDGTGSWRMHHTWYGPGHDPLMDYGDEYCARNGWFSRHWFATALIVFAVGFFVIAGINAALAAESDLPAGYSCADVRAAVEQYGRPKAIRLARRKGATPAQITAAEKCL